MRMRRAGRPREISNTVEVDTFNFGNGVCRRYHRRAAIDRAANQRRDDFGAVVVERRERLVEQ